MVLAKTRLFSALPAGIVLFLRILVKITKLTLLQSGL